jgi:hypothetical protein
MDRKSPSSLRTPERNSKISVGILNEGLVCTFCKIKFKLFEVFGFAELLRVIYNADGIVFCLKKQIRKKFKWKGRKRNGQVY